MLSFGDLSEYSSSSSTTTKKRHDKLGERYILGHLSV